jgi:putative sigma-54 modulation protein
MNLQINAKFEVNDYLREVIEERINKLTTYLDKITSVDVYLKIGESRHRHAEDQIVEIRVDASGHTFFAEDHSDVFEKAVAGATDKVLHQIKKYKGQRQSYR